MSFFSSLFLAELWSAPARRRAGAILLLPLIVFAAARFLPSEEVSAPVQVGVVLPEEGGDNFWRGLEERSGVVVTFHRAGLARAERQVAAGRWDCALLLPEDFQARLERLELEGLFTLLIGPGSTVYPMVRETAFACVMECASPGIAAEYLLDSGIAEQSDLDGLAPGLRRVLADPDRVHVIMETASGGPLDPLTLAEDGTANLLSGLTAILLLLWALLTAMDLGRWLDSPFARRTAPLRGVSALLLPRLAAALLPALCAGTLALIASRRPPASGFLALAAYLVFWGAAAAALARCRRLWSALPVLLPFVPVLCLVLSPVLVDVSLVFPALGPVSRWMPVTLFLRACGGVWKDALILAAGGTLLLALPIGLDQQKPATGAAGIRP